MRNKVIWAKTNPMPSSVTDRLTLTYEIVYFLIRSPHYFFDLDAIREPHRSSAAKRARPPLNLTPDWAGPLAASRGGLRRAREAGLPGHALGKNPGDVWHVATRGYRGAHFATFPRRSSGDRCWPPAPQAVCTACGQAWQARTTRCSSVLAASRQPSPGVVLDPFFGSGTVGVAAQSSAVTGSASS